MGKYTEKIMESKGDNDIYITRNHNTKMYSSIDNSESQILLSQSYPGRSFYHKNSNKTINWK